MCICALNTVNDQLSVNRFDNVMLCLHHDFAPTTVRLNIWEMCDTLHLTVSALTWHRYGKQNKTHTEKGKKMGDGNTHRTKFNAIIPELVFSSYFFTVDVHIFRWHFFIVLDPVVLKNEMNFRCNIVFANSLNHSFGFVLHFSSFIFSSSAPVHVSTILSVKHLLCSLHFSSFFFG